jgi:surface antigen
MNKLRWVFIIVLVIAAGIGIKLVYFYARYEIGEPIDSLNHVQVFYNGSTSNVLERNTTSENYNLGLKYQCVEFVKRYYYEFLQHKMPDSYGHAKDFFNPAIADGQLNTQRNLLQFTNGSKSQPKVNDILVLDKSRTNSYGHVAIISAVEGGYIEIIQQNAGKYATSRDIMELIQEEGKWVIKNDRVLGWLRIKN